MNMKTAAGDRRSGEKQKDKSTLHGGPKHSVYLQYIKMKNEKFITSIQFLRNNENKQEIFSKLA